jgi:hypothetical protein
MVDKISQHPWSEAELLREGFEPYERKKELVMARQLSEFEAPKRIVTNGGEKLIAEAGYMICYRPGEIVRSGLDTYQQWPVEPEIFAETYRAWDEPLWTPTPAEKHLMELGCLPYYKAAGVWAKKLDEPVYVQSLEQNEPELVQTGRYVAIGAQGEPYSMSDESFARRYYRRSSTALSGLWQRIWHLLGSDE